MPGFGRVLLVCAIATLAARCAGGSTSTTVIHLRDLPQRPTFDLAWVRNERAAAAVAMAVMEQELRLPRLDVTLHVFEDRPAFERALLTSGYEPAFAQLTAARMDAIGGYRQVLVNGARVSPADAGVKVALLAHELTHSLQYELGGGTRGTSAQWLREGFAEWVAARVLEALGVQPVEAFRARRVAVLRAARQTPLPPLGRMLTFRDWVDLAADGVAATSAKAFLAADWLVERRGVEAVLRYFEQFARSPDPDANFERAFGEPPGAFEQALDEYLGGLR
jgi:hypothetical protein